jgi:N-acetylglucosaminyldiphosphoundecaprenol N-acetyl-beta-D-mannosaminyltransferase
MGNETAHTAPSSPLQPADIDRQPIRFLGSPIHPLTMTDTLAVMETAIRERRRLAHCVVNVAKLVTMRRDPILRRAVTEADLINADGMGVVWGANLCGLGLPERVAGVDLMEALFAMCENGGHSVFLFGARQEVLDEALRRLAERHPDLRIVGARNGYFSPDEESAIVAEIAKSGADCLFVGMSSPRKEIFNHQHGAALGVPVVMGVGGGIDILAGLTQRAPDWMQSWGLEWFYRVLQEPRRMWRRYLVTNARYAGMLLVELFRGERSDK